MVRPGNEAERACYVEMNLTQSESTLEALAKRLLRQSPYRAVRQVSCALRDGVLVLTGGVPSYYQKQMAQNVLLRRLQPTTIDNQLQVDRA